MRKYGLLGEGIQYSQSPRIWARIWQGEGVTDASFELLDTNRLGTVIDQIKRDDSWQGVMVTTPYKEMVINYLDDLSDTAKAIGAVNAIRIREGRWTGYNTDVYGFLYPLRALTFLNSKALVLGTGGAAKAVCYGLGSRGFEVDCVSRTHKDGVLRYDDITRDTIEDYAIVVNATPLGGPKFPDEAPAIPYDALLSGQVLYDLSYHTDAPRFLASAPDRCLKINGRTMLYQQALEAYRIFSDKSSDKSGGYCNRDI
ncbi:MAG: shikimate dehydrogenase [Porphyromonas sp.]|nr:shikimate dehydrogenase [Porphyromonas sp.]